MSSSPSLRVWTVAEAKARLSEVLRLADEEGAQRIGMKKRFIVIPESRWLAAIPSRPPFGRWLIEHLEGGVELELPDRSEPEREIPFLTDLAE